MLDSSVQTPGDGSSAHDVTGKVANIIKLFGLSNAAKTIVGDNLIRGVSGGEKKRVTLAEMMMGNPRVLLLGTVSLVYHRTCTLHTFKFNIVSVFPASLSVTSRFRWSYC